MENKDVTIKRLDILKNEMILSYLDEIDFNNEKERYLAYETLLSKTIIEGEFDDIFLSNELEDLDKNERKRILDLSRKYSSLCFYRGDFKYWLDSVEGVTLSDLDLIVSILLRNFNYIIRLAKNGGEEVLEFLNKFKNIEVFGDGPVIAFLLLRFIDDDTLEKVLIEMVKEDGLYKDFTDTQKIIMCDFPEGVLYKNNNGNIELISSIKEISNLYSGEDNSSIKDIDSEVFTDIIESIYSKYNKV